MRTLFMGFAAFLLFVGTFLAGVTLATAGLVQYFIQNPGVCLQLDKLMK